ncbi:MAG TPA: response regulator [Anaeromyxobacteraceae bacterium]|nr:response regulator [Anaeromyxobacteraceae bacterium]
MSAVATRGEVMVIEDDFAIRETLRELLEDQGFHVTGAANGREALARLAEHAPRLILLDLMMPVMDGIEFRSAQQRDERLAGIPVVVISADHGLAQKASNMAVEGFLAKPFELDELIETVQRYC